MKTEDLVTRIAGFLPRYTDKLTRNIRARSIARSGSVATIECDQAHQLAPEMGVIIVGAKTPISISSLTRSGVIATAVTASAHDLTPAILETVEIEGADQAEFNGSFLGHRVVSDTEIEFLVADAGPTTATGSPILTNGASALQQWDGAYRVLETPTPTRLTVEVDPTLPNPVGEIEIRAEPRVAGAVDIESVLASYTEHPEGDGFLFVVLDDVVASKSRRIESDAVDNIQRQQFYRQQLIQQASLYYVLTVSDQIAARPARDDGEDLFRPICRSILFRAFDSGLHQGARSPLQFVSHGAFRYDGAVYTHAYTFQQVADTYFEDTVGPDLDVALRSIDLAIFPNLPDEGATGVASLDATIDLTEPEG